MFDVALGGGKHRGARARGRSYWKVGEPRRRTVVLFSFNRILRRENRVKNLQERLSSRKLLRLMPVSARSTWEKCFADLPGLSALDMHTTATRAAVAEPRGERAVAAGCSSLRAEQEWSSLSINKETESRPPGGFDRAWIRSHGVGMGLGGRPHDKFLG